MGQCGARPLHTTISEHSLTLFYKELYIIFSFCGRLSLSAEWAHGP